MKHKHKGFKINGNAPWLSIIAFLIIQSIAVGMWAGKADQTLTNIQTQLVDTKVDLKEDIKDNKERISYIEKLVQLIPKRDKKFLGVF